MAMNIAAFPCQFGDIFAEVLHGGADKVEEAGALVVGGHSLEDKEPKYGLAVTGLAHPNKVISNAGAKIGDALVLTKPLGFGILATAIKQEIILEKEIPSPIREARFLNQAAAEAMVEVGVDACTDISGFGLLGHLSRMLEVSAAAADLNEVDIPVWRRALELAKEGYIPGGTGRNRAFFDDRIAFATPKAKALDDILFDPQTSGGLLIAVNQNKVNDLLFKLQASGVRNAATIGTVVDGRPGYIRVS